MIVYPIGRCTTVLLLSGDCFRHPRLVSLHSEFSRAEAETDLLDPPPNNGERRRYHAYPDPQHLTHTRPSGPSRRSGTQTQHNKPPILSHRTTFPFCSTLPPCDGTSRTNVEEDYISTDLGLRCSLVVACVGGFGLHGADLECQ
jgi:hypothetical protein